MDNNKNEILTRVLENVMEQLAFMFGEPAQKDELILEEEKCLHISMQFNGLRNGKLDLVIPASMGISLAANILGLDEDDEEAENNSVDALKELVNMVCGQFLTEAYGDKPVFNLTIPTVEEIDRGDWQKLLDRPESVGMIVEDIPLIGHVT